MTTYYWPSRGVTSLNGLAGDLTLVAGSGITIVPSGSTITISATGSGSGTVTSVALTAPASILSVSGSPVTSAGTLALSLVPQNNNTVWAGPITGGPLNPTFRLLDPSDIPALNYVTAVTATSPLFSSGGFTPNLTIQQANSTQDGYLSSTDWNTFNNKQPAGNYITALTGDVTATGPGSAVATLKNTGTPGTYVQVTTDAQGRVTAGVVAPLPTTAGGTGLTSYNTGDLIYGSASNVLSTLPIGTTGQVLTVNAGIPAWEPASGQVYTFAFNNNQTSYADVTNFYINPANSHAFTSEMSVERVNPTIVEDTTFATNTGLGFDDIVYASAIQSNGQIVLGGAFTVINGTNSNSIARLNSDGTTDTTFSTNIGTGFNDIVFAVLILSDQTIMVGGQFTSFNGTPVNYIAKLNADGTLNSTFVTNIGTGFDNDVFALALQADTNIVVGGGFANFNGSASGAIARLSPSGVFDSAFQTNIGTGFTASSGAVHTLYVQIDQNILVGGTFTSFQTTTANNMTRITSSGTLDSAFNTNLGSGFDDQVSTVVQEANAQILVGGSFLNFNGNSRADLVRLNSDGTEDTAFYGNLGTGFDSGVSVVVEKTSTQIIVGGDFLNLNGNSAPRLVILNNDGTVDATSTSIFGTGANRQVQTLALQPDQAFVIGGRFLTINGNIRHRIDRYDSIMYNLISVQTIKGVYRDSSLSWTIQGFDAMGDATGVSFQMTDLGQLQYESTNIVSTPILNQMKFEITEL